MATARGQVAVGDPKWELFIFSAFPMGMVKNHRCLVKLCRHFTRRPIHSISINGHNRVFQRIVKVKIEKIA